jgi:hypothetical protein
MKNEKIRTLGPGQRPIVKAKYPHLWKKDYDTWTAFLRSEHNDFEQVWYDVHVGAPMHVPAGSPAFMKNVVDGVSRKRIDVVARQGKRLWIIEVKPEANMKGIGQVVTYKKLFVKEFRITESVKAMIIATTCDRDVLKTAEDLNVTIIALEGVTL